MLTKKKLKKEIDETNEKINAIMKFLGAEFKEEKSIETRIIYRGGEFYFLFTPKYEDYIETKLVAVKRKKDVDLTGTGTAFPMNAVGGGLPIIKKKK